MPSDLQVLPLQHKTVALVSYFSYGSEQEDLSLYNMHKLVFCIKMLEEKLRTPVLGDPASRLKLYTFHLSPEGTLGSLFMSLAVSCTYLQSLSPAFPRSCSPVPGPEHLLSS